MPTTNHIANPQLAAAGADRIAWAARRMPVLAAIRERFEKEGSLSGQRIGACLHVTAETANLMLALRQGGAEVALCASNPLSTQDDVAAALVAEGIPVFAIRGEDRDTYYQHLNAVLDFGPTITMDDGADLVTLLHTERKDLALLGSTEETTTGVIRLKAMEADGTLRLPVVAVNDSDTKHLFDNRYGTGQSSWDGFMRATNMLLAGKVVVVCGYGQCGQGVAERARGLGARVIVVEIDPIRALAATMDGFQVMTTSEASRIGDVFITVTGNTSVLVKSDFNAMRDGSIMGNAGHFDVEIDLATLRSMARSHRILRPNLEEFTLEDGRRLLVIAEGRLMNLGAAEGHPADVMDMSFSDQALAALWLVENAGTLKPQVYRLPKELDDEVARAKLEAMGGTLQVLRPEQIEYLASWQHGT